MRYAQAQGAPTVNLTHAKSTTPGLAEGQFLTQLQLNLPLIDGGSARAAVGVASANLQALESDLLALRSRCDGSDATCHIIEALHERADAQQAAAPAPAGLGKRHV